MGLRTRSVATRVAVEQDFNPDSPTIRVRSPRSGVVYSTVDTNLNTNWLENKASWLYYSLLVLASWLVVSNFVDPGMAWYVVVVVVVADVVVVSGVNVVIVEHVMIVNVNQDIDVALPTSLTPRTSDYRRTVVHICHGVITYYLFHWIKGSPIDGDQGKYDSLTFWEQIDSEVQGTGTRKFFMLVPVVLFLLASHGSAYDRQPLGVNLGVLIVLLVAKLSSMHRVRIFGINKY